MAFLAVTPTSAFGKTSMKSPFPVDALGSLALTSGAGMAGQTEVRYRLRKEAERIEEDCAYNNFGHYEAANTWKLIDHALSFPILILSAIAAFTAFSLPAVATALSIATTLLALAVVYFRPAETAGTHYRIGGKFKDLRVRARTYREIALLASDIPDEKLIQQLAELLEEKKLLSELGVPLPDFAYKRAKAKIRAGLATYDRDQSLPKP